MAWLLDSNILSELRRPNPEPKVVALSDWLMQRVRPMFYRRVLPITEDVMLQWRPLVEEGPKAGHTVSQPDLIIAATAGHPGPTVGTRHPSEDTQTRGALMNPRETSRWAHR